MHTIRTTPPAGVATLSRRLLVVMGALLVGARFAPHVAADRVPANGRSIADRVQDQSERCFVFEGDFSSRKTAFGSVITTCSGGKKPEICVNTAQSTTCHPPLTRPPDNIPPPPTTGDNTTRVSARRRHSSAAQHGRGKHRAHRQVSGQVAVDRDDDGPADPVGTDTDSDSGVGG
jgi:hypothetical protein